MCGWILVCVARFEGDDCWRMSIQPRFNFTMTKTATWMPFYIGDYLADTMHLSTVQHGAYLLLIMDYWRKRSALPDDDLYLASVAKLSQTEWQTHRKTIRKLFAVTDGVWYHRRVEIELERAIAVTDARSRAGTAGNAVRWGESSQKDRKTIAKRSQNDPPLPSPSHNNNVQRLTREKAPVKAEARFLQDVAQMMESWQTGSAAGELTNSGGWWRTSFRADAELMGRVLAEVTCMVKEGRIVQSPGQAAVDLWQRWAG